MAKKTVAAMKREAIYVDVEGALSLGNWTLALQAALAKRHNVTLRTIQNYRRRVEETWLEASRTKTPEVERVDFLQRLRNFQQKAYLAEKYVVLARMLETEARVLGLEKLALEVTHRGGVLVGVAEFAGKTDEELRAEIEDIRAGRLSEPTLQLLEAVGGGQEKAG